MVIIHNYISWNYRIRLIMWTDDDVISLGGAVIHKIRIAGIYTLPKTATLKHVIEKQVTCCVFMHAYVAS